MEYKGQFIGERKINEVVPLEHTTPGGVKLFTILYEDGNSEALSELMLDKVVSKKACDLTELRDKRVMPIVESVAGILRDWGLKIGETPYFSALLNQSLNYNTEEATKELWSKYMPKPASLDEIDLVTVDRVLKTVKPVTLNDVLGNQKP